MAQGREIDSLSVFISYSRRNAAAADALFEALTARGFKMTIDRRDLPFGEKWQAQLAEFIRLSDTVIWLISDASIRSEWVNWELDEVARRNKRLVPVMVGDTPRDKLPRQLGEIHILPVDGVFEIERDLPTLVRVLETDYAWLKEASRLGDRAHEWQVAGRPLALLLRGSALASAEIWRDRRPAKAPAPGQDVLDLVLASRQAATRQLRWWIGGSVAVAVGAIALAGYAVVQRLFAEQEGAHALANARTATARLLANQAVAELDTYPQRAGLLLGRATATARLASQQIPPDVRQALYRVGGRLGGTLLPRTSELMADQWLVVPQDAETAILRVTDLCEARSAFRLPGRFDNFIHDAKTGTALLVGVGEQVLLELPGNADGAFRIKGKVEVAVDRSRSGATKLSQAEKGLSVATTDFAIRYVGIGIAGDLIDATSPPIPGREFFANRANIMPVEGSPTQALLSRISYEPQSGMLIFQSRKGELHVSKRVESGFSPWREALSDVARVWMNPMESGYLVAHKRTGELSVHTIATLGTGRELSIAKLGDRVDLEIDATGEWLVAGDGTRTVLARVRLAAGSVKTFDLTGTWGSYGLKAKFSPDSRYLLTRVGD